MDLINTFIHNINLLSHMQYSVEKMFIVQQLILSFVGKICFVVLSTEKKCLLENVCKFMASSKLWIYCLKKLTLNMYCISGTINYFEHVFFNNHYGKPLTIIV